MDNIEKNENIEEVNVVTLDETTKQEKKSRRNKNKKGYGKIAMSGTLVFGMAIGSAFTLTQVKDSIVAEVTENVLNNSTMYTNTSYDSSVNQLSNNSNSNIVADVMPSIVSIGILGPYSDTSLSGAGTGVIFDQDDTNTYIVTNNHVITGANGVKIWFDGYEQSVDANLVGKDPSNDLAIISVANKDLEKIGLDEVITCTFGDSDEARVGDSVLAIGNAMGEGISTTGGMISNKNKTITESTGAEIAVIQTDASINPGNSGGALVNSNGEVIGINTAKMSQTFNNSVEGVGYAIPSNDVVAVIDEIMNSADSPNLGISGRDMDVLTAKLYKLPEMGVIVASVIEDGPADLAGVKPNDVITSFNNETVADMDTLKNLIADCEVGDKVPMTVYRDGEIIEQIVTLQEKTNLEF